MKGKAPEMKKPQRVRDAGASEDNVKTEQEMNVMSKSITAVASVTPETMPAITYAGRPVVTTALLAKLYGTDDNNLIKNFQRNAERFTVGKHYHKLEGAELKAFKNCMTDSHAVEIPRQTRNLILWTERGAARHAKMLDTDQAWEVFEKLEDCYFGKVEPANAQPARSKPKALPNGLTSDQQESIKALVKARVEALPASKQGGAAIRCWSSLKSKFGCSYKEIDPVQFTEAVSLLARLPLEGELLEAEAPAPRLEIDFPVSRWLAENPWLAKQQQFQGEGNLLITAGMLCGMDVLSPSLRLLGDLARSGHNVEACKLEVLAMRHHLEVLNRTLDDIRHQCTVTIQRGVRFKVEV